MTEQNAIDSIRIVYCDTCEDGEDECSNCLFQKSIDALEKQIPKKPLGGADFEGNQFFICPECCAIVQDGVWYAVYCPDCGRKLDWSC